MKGGVQFLRKKIPVILLIVLLVSSIVYIVFLQKKYTNCNKNNKNDEPTVDKNKVSKEREYDCTFTQTYHVVNLLDGYIAEVPELSYVILDKFLDHQAISHFIPTSLKNELENDKYYEFTYQLKGKGYIENMDDETLLAFRKCRYEGKGLENFTLNGYPTFSTVEEELEKPKIKPYMFKGETATKNIRQKLA